MKTTELIDLLKKHERGGATGRPREITLTVNGTFMPNPHFYVDSTDDGLYTGICIGVSGETAQEQRVLTREELKQFEGSPCWFESSGTYRGKDGFWIIPAMFRTFSAGIIMSYTSVLDGLTDYGELGLSAYNKAWRCWSSKPTEEEREAVKWTE